MLELIFDNFFCSTLHTDINIAYTIQQKKGLKTKECLGGNARSVVGSKKASWQAERSTVIPAQPPPRQQTNKLKTNKHCGKKQTASMGGAKLQNVADMADISV